MWQPSLLALRRSSSTRVIHPKAFSRAAFTGEGKTVGAFPFSNPFFPSSSSPPPDSSGGSSPFGSKEDRWTSTRTGMEVDSQCHRPITDPNFSPRHVDETPRESSLVPLSSSTSQGSSKAKKRRVTFPLLPVPSRRVIIHQLEDPIPSSSLTSSTNASSASLTGKHLWGATRLARENKNVRRTQQVCVVGGKESIQRIWSEYRIRPHVVYVPNVNEMEEEETEGSTFSPHDNSDAASIPSWCLTNTTLPTYIVRCSPVDIQRHLLSASFSTPYAAEFPWHPSQLLPLAHAIKTEVPTEEAKTEKTSETGGAELYTRSISGRGGDNIDSMLVLVGLRIPSNVGMLIHAAEVMGFASVALIHCVDPFQEKVLRASHGSALSPKLQLYEYEDPTSGSGPPTGSCSVVSLLCTIAAQHHLMPLLAVPSQEEEPAFEIAKRFHCFNVSTRTQKLKREGDDSDGTIPVASSFSTPLGPMLVLGGESKGLESLADAPWTVPYQTVTLPIPNATVDSLNVGVAGSILMDLFRPSAEKNFKKVEEITGPSPIPLVE